MAKNVSKKPKMKMFSKPYSDDIHTAATHVPDMPSEFSDRIVDYLNLCKNFESHIAEYRNIWKVTLEDNLLFYQLDVTDHPMIKVSIKIDKKLKVDVFTKHGKIGKKHMKFLLNSELVLQQWFQLKKLLEHFGPESSYNHINIKYCLSQSLNYLKNCQDNISVEEDNISLKAKVEFLSSQIHALILNKYTPSMLFLAYSIYLKSSSCYKHIQSLDFLILPQEEDLVKYAINADMTDEEKVHTLKL